ncbi:MAG: polyphosphate polymerase domain-containing protein [Clostridiales bacterium]|nr:polyphosphate polymerase domain-containing protein [Clostridiales bacterium]
MNLQEVLRNERKFLINISEFMRKSHELQQLLREDSHNGPQGYKIRSLYFDTEYDGDFFDKEYGMEIRKKLRLRIYDPLSGSAVLEMKQKQGEQQRKRSLRLCREDAERLIACDYSPLLRYPDEFARECYALMNTRCYRPRTIVEYRRKAFIAKENNIRITFDHQIDATESNFGLFDPNLIMNPVMGRSMAVLEVKYNGFLLSYIRQMLDSIDKSELSVSKYCMARQLSYQPHL